MNAVTVHKHELQRLLAHLSRDRLVLRVTFVALLDAYVARLEVKCLDLRARVSIPRQRKEMHDRHLQSTSMRGRLRYNAQDVTSEKRAVHSGRFSAMGRNQVADVRRRLWRHDGLNGRRLFRDNGR